MRATVLAMALALALATVARAQSVAVISHRGDNRNYPENTMLAFESSLQLGVDYIEVDIRTTSDGFLVVIHDDTVDRTTNGTGRVRQHTFAEIRALDAGGWFAPQFAGLQVPTFNEVAQLAQRYNRSMYLDLKDGTSDKVYADLVATGMEARAVVYSGPVRMKQLQVLDARVKPMPEAVNRVVLEASIELFDPLQVVAFNDNDFRDPVIELAQSIGADIYVDRLGSADTTEFWADAVARGATGIQTNLPADLLAFLRANGNHP